MRPIDARFDGCLHDRLQRHRATEPARSEALNDVAALNRLEIRLIGTGHDETGTTGRAAEIANRTL